jgi:hypothetical protein
LEKVQKSVSRVFHYAHIPAIGLGIMKGEQDALFTEMGKRFFTIVIYQPVFFRIKQLPAIPVLFIRLIFFLTEELNGISFSVFFNPALTNL